MSRGTNGRVSKKAKSNDAGSAAVEELAVSSPPDQSRQSDDQAAAGRARLSQIRSRLEAAVGQLVLLMMQSARYRHQSLADLNHLLIEPLLRDRIAVAHARDSSEPSNHHSPVGAAIWATVNEAADQKIREQIKAGSFPVRLSGDEWNSGEIVWLLDLIAINQKAATAVLLNFKSLAGERQVQLHPVVSKTIDPGLLEQLKVRA